MCLPLDLVTALALWLPTKWPFPSESRAFLSPGFTFFTAWNVIQGTFLFYCQKLVWGHLRDLTRDN